MALVTYRARRAYPDGIQVENLRSSLWHLRDDKWRMVFHQDTPTSVPRDTTQAVEAPL